jgi:hypothetical protein
MAEEKILWFVGIDWASEKHQVCVLDAQGAVAGEREFAHSGASLAEQGDWILSIAGDASAVAAAIEVPHGPVVDSLLDRDFVVYSINPKQLDRLRDRFGVAGAKDARRDGRVCADGLRTDRHRLPDGHHEHRFTTRSWSCHSPAPTPARRVVGVQLARSRHIAAQYCH